MKTINHPWKNKVTSLEKKLDATTTELIKAKATITENIDDMYAKEQKAIDDAYKIRGLESNYALAKSWAKWASATALVLGLTTAYLAVRPSVNEPINTESDNKIVSVKTESVANDATKNTISANKSIVAPKFWYIHDTPGAGHTTLYYPIFKDDNALDMRAYAQSGSKIYELESGSGGLDGKGFLIPKELQSQDGSFQVWAIDRNGNESKRKTLYTLRNFVSTTVIPR